MKLPLFLLLFPILFLLPLTSAAHDRLQEEVQNPHLLGSRQLSQDQTPVPLLPIPLSPPDPLSNSFFSDSSSVGVVS